VSRPGPDNVGLVLHDIKIGAPIRVDSGVVPARADINAGHKVALRPVRRGANILAFTTGHGSLFGSRPAPGVKISTTTRLFDHMRGDVDFDAGPAMSHEKHVRYGIRLFELVVDTASGLPSKSEALGFGAEEIAPWRMGAVQ